MNHIPNIDPGQEHMLTRALLQASEILDRPPSPIWREIEARLPLFATTGPPEKPRIAIWEGQDLAVCHRHHSHLASVYPFDLTAGMTPAQRDCVDHAIEHWIKMGMGAWSEWCFPATPSAWRDVSFRDLPLSDGFRINATRSNGRTDRVELASSRGGILVLDVPDRRTMTLSQGGRTEKVTFPLELELEISEQVSLC